MMKSAIQAFLLVIAIILIVGCVQKNQDTKETSSAAQSVSSVPKLGDLCTGNEECNDFCDFNSLECEEYCISHSENPTCQERFAFVYKEGYVPLTAPFKDYGEYSVTNDGCEGEGAATFTSSPMRLEDIETIRPLGLITSEGHITPTDHQYYYPFSFRQGLKEESLRDVYAPADGVVTTVEIMPDYFNTAKGTGLGDYRLIIHHTCTFFTIYIHLRWIPPKIQEIVEKSAARHSPVKVEAGELIGKATAFDFSAHDEDVTLTGFVVPEHYRAEPWKIHTVDPFDYFAPELRTQLLTKNLRTAEPLGGKIDYDVDGKLIGNWFVENTYGYLGIKRPDYYVTHISLAPNALDPRHFIIALGDYDGKGAEFGSDGPNPADVDVSSGMVKYELRNFDYSDDAGNHWDRISYTKSIRVENTGPVHGVLLVQLIDKRKLRFEAFPGKIGSEVTGFTNNSVIYER